MKKSSILLSSLCILMFTASCTQKQNTENNKDEEARPLVKLERVTLQPVQQLKEYTGTIQPEIKNNIAPSSPVRIEKIYVEVGDNVKKGEKLVQMDAANLKKLELQINNQEIEFKRVDELYKVGGASKAEWDNAKMALEVNKTSYDNMLENTRLVSPIDGIVTARNYDNGDMYSGGNPVLTVEQIRPVKLLINVSESYFPIVKTGDKVKVSLDVYPGEEFTGNVSLIYPTIDKNTRTFTVEVSLPNTNTKIRPGMFARATMNYGTVERVVVPDRAIVKQAGAGDRYVYIYNEGKVSYDKVETGQRLGDKYELISGVKNGAQVVVAGQSRLSNGCEVTVENN